MGEHRVSFGVDGYGHLELKRGERLCEALDSHNSPLLFGCRTGICGTCLVRVHGAQKPPDEDESELLEVLAPGDSEARLACQIEVVGDIVVEPHPGG